MLKRLLLSLTLLYGAQLVSGQTQLGPENLRQAIPPRKYTKKIQSGAESPSQIVNQNVPIVNRFGTEREENVGSTYYDLQSNAGIGRRIDVGADGKIYAVWTQGNSSGASSGFPGRGTGFNVWDPSTEEWGDIPDERIEDERCGWPNIAELADGNPINISHSTDQNLMLVHKWNGTEWVESTVTTNTPEGIIWPRMAVGGPDGNTVHVIGLTYPLNPDPIPVEGLVGHVLYYRSLDGGESWDIIDMKLPELDSNFYSSHSADNYYIDANGSTVAVGYFANWGDSKIFKSTDNGENWTATTLWDFPLDAYNLMDGYTVDDVPIDPEAPEDDPLAILTSDETGTVLVDNDGMVHAWFGEMYVSDDNYTDESFTFYPGHMGLRYWNEDMGENNSIRLVSSILDENGNDTLDVVAGIPLYFTSLTSHPTAGIDENGIIYLAYSSLSETRIKSNANGQNGTEDQHCRGIVVMASTDGGGTWTEPWDVIVAELVQEESFLDFHEASFPAVARTVDEKMHILYQNDYEPGLSAAIQNYDGDIIEENYMNYIGLDAEDVLNGGLPSGLDKVPAEQLSFEVSPNPASGLVRIGFDLPETAPTSITIYDMTGREVKSFNRGELFAGIYFNTIDVSDLSSGIYLIRLQTGDKVATQKLQVN